MDISVKDLQVIRDCLYVAETGADALPRCPESESLSGKTEAIHRIRQEIEARLLYIKTSLDL